MISPAQQAELLKMADGKAKVFADMHEQGIHVWNLISKDLYSDPAHCIFELLQNAEDEGATVVQLTLNERELRLVHRGRAFSVNDIKSICSVGDNQEKKEKRNTIGRFGIGFKSVYSVTDKPTIRSGGIEFQIRNFIIPEFAFDVEDDGATTITLPFGDDRVLAAKRFALLTATLQGMDHRHILFLSNIHRIEWSIEGARKQSRVLERTAKKPDGAEVSKVFVRDGAREQVFLMGERPVKQSNKDLSIKIALLLQGNAGERDLAVPPTSPLFAFFPTAVESKLPFLFHAPFLTTPARDNLQDDDAATNEMLFTEAFVLLCSIVDELIARKMPTKALWNVLPCDASLKELKAYGKMYSSLVQKARRPETNWLRGRDGQMHQASGVQLSSAREFPTLITDNDCTTLFGRKTWAQGNTTAPHHTHVFKFFQNELGIPVIGWSAFREALTEEFLQAKSDTWMAKFYSAIASTGTIDPWKTLPVLKLRDGSMRAAYGTDAKRKVFLPDRGGSSYPCVKESLAHDQEAKPFFRALELRKPDIVDEVNELVIPRIGQHVQPYAGLGLDIMRILRAVRKAVGKERETLYGRLKALRFLPARNHNGQSSVLVTAKECYFPSPSLLTYFQGNETPLWLDTALLGRITRLSEFVSLMQALELRGQPARESLESSYLSKEELDAITGSFYTRTPMDHHLVHLSDFLTNIKDRAGSQCLWDVIIGKAVPYKVPPKELLTAEVLWEVSFRKHKRPFPSTALKLLQNTAWLFDANDVRTTPNNLTLSALHSCYDRTTKESESLVAALEFKADAISAFEEEHGVKVLSKEEYDDFIAFKKRQEQNIAAAMQSQPEPAAILLDVSTIEGEEVDLDELLGTGTQEDGLPLVAESTLLREPLARNGTAQAGSILSEPITPYQKGLGDWGETYVKQVLRKRIATDQELELIDLNANGQTGVGADLRLMRSGQLLEAIEIKTTPSDVDGAIKISGIQWGQAQRFHERGEGDKYCVYCVFKANTARPKLVVLRDPIQLKKDGKIRFQDLLVNLAV